MNELDLTYPDTNGWLKAFKFSPRSTAIEFLPLVVSFIQKRLLVPKFKLAFKSKTFSGEKNSSTLFEFAHSQINVNGNLFDAVRLVSKGGDFQFGPGIQVTKITNTNKTINFFENGEDPRLFQWIDTAWMYWQRPVSRLTDTQIFLTNLNTQKTFELKSPFNINGKNWVPYVAHNNELQFLYSLEPLVILKLDGLHDGVNMLSECNQTTEDTFEWGDEKQSFGKNRGGTALIKISDSEYLGFTHITYSGKLKESHTLGAYIFDASKLKITHKELTKLRPRTQIDPYGASSNDSHVKVHTTLSTGNPVRNTVVGFDLILEFEILELVKYLTLKDSQYKVLRRKKMLNGLFFGVQSTLRYAMKVPGALNRRMVRKVRNFLRRRSDWRYRRFEKLQLIDLVPQSLFDADLSLKQITLTSDWKSEVVSEKRFKEVNFFFWMKFLREKARLHSKQFQYYAILEKAYSILVTSPNRPNAIGFGVGNEPIPAALVSLGFDVIATDYLDGEIADEWQATGQLITSPSDLNERGIADPEAFQNNFKFMNMDMNNIPNEMNETYDFVWSTCALGHIGSYQRGLDFIFRSSKLLKSGGWAVHSTELDLSEETSKFDTPNLSLYKLEDLQLLVKRLEAAGNDVMPLQMNNWREPSEKFAAFEPWGEKPHLRINVLNREIVSIVIIFQKK